jgi:nucleoside 2-deoxyribosyltransferase
MLVVYVAGKYTDDSPYKVKQNIFNAELLGMKIVEMFGSQGVMVIVPHTNTAHWEGIQSEEWFYQATEELLKRSDACIYIEGDIERSKGTRNEVAYCTRVKKPVFAGNAEGFEAFSRFLDDRQRG